MVDERALRRALPPGLRRGDARGRARHRPGAGAAFPRLLPPGERVEVGPGSIYQAVRALGSGADIDLEGTATSLDFDLGTGDATADFAVYCLSPGGPGGPPAEVESGLFFRARSRKLEGTMRCP